MTSLHKASDMVLTIVVPTYNRADRLELLLRTLVRELAGLESQVGVIVSDNASTDRTPEVTAEFRQAFPSAAVTRQAVNLGADGNFCFCVENVKSRHMWMLGDDDLPRAGLLRLLVDLLSAQAPDLVYLQPSELTLSMQPSDTPALAALQPLWLDRLAFARRLHVNFTFISTLVVNLETYRRSTPAPDLRRYTGTSLVQLGWIFDVLKVGEKFIHVSPPCVLAMPNNSGGYSYLKVFGQNFPAIVAQSFGRHATIAAAMRRRCAVKFLPNVIWGLRFASIGDFKYEDASAGLRSGSGAVCYWLVLRPICRLPKPLARLALVAARLWSYALSVHDRALEFVTRPAHSAD